MTLTLTVPPRTDEPALSGLPVAIIGAGPVGLAAAAHLLERGLDVVIYEAGPSVATSVRAWGHTRLFTPWEYLVDDAAARLLDAAEWESPAAERMPTGRDLITDYLQPLAETPELASRLRFGARVEAVTRKGMDRTRSTGRASTPFLLRVTREGNSTDEFARALIDTSGTYTSPNPLGSSGLPTGSAENVVHALPDVLGTERDQFAGKRVLVVGAGHSAANTLFAIAALAKEVPGTTVSWAIRTATPSRVYGSAADELPARGSLGAAVHNLVTAGAVNLIARFEINDTSTTSTGTTAVHGTQEGADLTVEVDVVVNATGYRPDLGMLREIRLALDDVVEAPRALAGLIDPNLHSCGSVPPHGVVELAHPEPNFFLAGMKSYGRAPTFLLRTGYEQVRSIAAELAGDHTAARQVHLVLPETGICSTNLDASSCCTTTAEPESACCS